MELHMLRKKNEELTNLKKEMPQNTFLWENIIRENTWNQADDKTTDIVI